MEELIQTIPKNSKLESSQDFELLRTKGIEHIQKLGNKLWTDYNPHDPGITLLELLSYAITDLGYRTGFDMKDLLAPENGDLSVFEETFHKAAKIFPCNQVTVTDLRKLLIDIDGIRNAWVRVSDKFETTYFVDFNNSLLMETMPGPNIISMEVEKLKGLYDIVIEFDRNIVRKGDSTKENDVWKQAKKEVHKHRNLCEDFYSEGLIVKKPDGCEEIKIYADIDVLPNSDNEGIFAEVLIRLERFFSPTVTFYSMQELFEKGLRSDQVFEGPLLNHGFVSDEELQAIQKMEVIHTSDLYNILMDIEGVIAVRNLAVENFVNMSCLNPGTPVSQGPAQKWCLELYNKANPSTPLDLDLVLKATNAGDLNQIRFYKGDKDIPVSVDTALVFSKLEVLRLSDMKKRERLENEVFDLEIPVGEFRELNDYYPVQNELPMTYGTGEEGLANTVSEERKAQAKQLKAYLLFFEQLLANYLSQLFHVRELFSWNDQTDKTYFSQVVQGVKDMNQLYVPSYVDEDGNTINLVVGGNLQQNTLADIIQKDTESDDVFFDRRNRFLNHLIARFNEVFTEYSLVMMGIGKSDEIIPDKARFLADYDVISHSRGKGFDLKKIQPVTGTDGDDYKPEVWDTLNNVSGYEFRISRFLGIDDVKRRFLYAGHDFSIESVMTSPSVQEYFFALRIDFNGTELVLNGELESSDDLAFDAFNDMLAIAPAFTYTPIGSGPYQFEVYDGATLLATSQDFDTSTERNNAMNFVSTDYFVADNLESDTGYLLNAREGLHVIEHILLRPKNSDYNYLPVSTEPTDTILTSQYENIVVQDLGLDPSYGVVPTGSIGMSLYEIPVTDPKVLLYNIVSPDPQATYTEVKKYGHDFSSYEMKNNGPVTAPFFFYVRDTSGIQLGESPYFTTAEARNTAMLKLLAYLHKLKNGSLGTCSSTVDPYSYRATVVLPAWMERANNYSYRALAEKIIRLEAPAHVSLDIFWIDRDQMRELEICYRRFLMETAKGDPNLPELTADPAALVARANCTMDKISNLKDAFAAIYVVEPKKSEDYFRNTSPLKIGHLFASVTDPQGSLIVKATIVGGDPLPLFFGIQGDTGTDSILTKYNVAGTFNVGDIILVSSHPSDQYNNPNHVAGVIPGVWKIVVETVNDLDKVTCNEITLEIDEDSEAVWTVEPAKHQNCYDTFDLLASAMDGDNYIDSAQLVAPFTLPPGVALNEGPGFIPAYDSGIDNSKVGHLIVLNPALLKSAVDTAGTSLSYPLKIHTVDGFGGETVAEIVIVIQYDMSFTMEQAFNGLHIDLYTDTDPDPHPNSTDILQLIDTDGIVSVVLLTTDPDNSSISDLNDIGIDLFIEGPDSSHGYPIYAYFRVVDHDLLKTYIDDTTNQNIFQLLIEITDGCGYVQNVQVNLMIKPDTEAEVVVIPVQHVNNFNTGETVVTISDIDGGIVNVEVIPDISILTSMGLQLSYASGNAYIKVQDQNQFEMTVTGGLFTPVIINSRDAYRYSFDVITTDACGGVSDLTITIEAYKDREAEYVFSFPSGTSILAYLNFPSHENNNNNVLKKAPFGDFKLKSVDSLPAEKAVEFSQLAAPVLFDSNNPIVANVYDADGPIVSAEEMLDTFSFAPVGSYYKLGTDTTLVVSPAAPVYTVPLSHWGALLNPITGTISIGMNSTAMTKAFNEYGVGTHHHRIKTIDSEGGVTIHELVIVISKDLPAVYKAQGAYPRSYDKYAAGEVIKYAEDPNGRVVSATIKSGSLPPGTEFDTKTGEIRVLPAVSLAPVVVADSVSFTIGETSGVVSVPVDEGALAFKSSGPVTSEAKSAAATSLVAGTWNLTIKTVDEFGGVTDNIPVSIVLNPKAVVGTKKFFTETVGVLGSMEGKYTSVLAKKPAGETLFSSPSVGLSGGGLSGGEKVL